MPQWPHLEALVDRREINTVLNGAGLRPQHKFGQNFMVDQTTLARIADAGAIGPQDVVLEVGPGVGNLTRLLAQRAAAVLAVDIDAPLLAAAQQHHRAATNSTWLQEDVLAGKHEVSPAVLTALQRLHERHADGAVKLVSNLPYNVASPLIAGPSAMATAMLIAGSNPGRMWEWIGALAICIMVTVVVFSSALRIRKLLGEQVITALERLMGLVLTAISIEMLLSGVADFIRHLKV